jgi:uncharacterized membrane protein HdeD (DUF308 family)
MSFISRSQWIVQTVLAALMFGNAVSAPGFITCAAAMWCGLLALHEILCSVTDRMKRNS